MELLLAAIALTLVPEINGVGRLTVCELILAAVAVGSFVKEPQRVKGVTQFYIFAGIWFCGALLSDLYDNTSSDDIVRGWSKILFLVLNFTGIRVLVGRSVRLLVIFIFFLFVAGSIRVYLGVVADELAQDATGPAWRFGHGQLVSAASFLLSAQLQQPYLLRVAGNFAPFCAAATNLLFNARNLTGVTALAALLNAFTSGRRTPISNKQIIYLGVIGLAAGVAILNVYSYAAWNGFLGNDARDKYIAQSRGELSIIQGGRTESLASTQAIIDSPIVGHGSWARDFYYVSLMVSRMAEAGVVSEGNPFESDLIPTHSHLFGAWVEHGVLGAAFWFWVIWITLKGMRVAVRQPTPLSGFYTFIALSLLWDVFFSPFGLDRRVVVAAWVYLMLLIDDKPLEKRTKGVA